MKTCIFKRWLLLMMVLSGLWVAVARAQDATPTAPVSPTLTAVQARGQLICGIDDEIFGFGFLNPNTGAISGIQVDFCRALAVAILGEAVAVDFRLHTMDAPVADVLNQRADVMFHHTLILDLAASTQPGLDVGRAAVFYDGTSLMTEVGSDIAGWDELDGAAVCLVEDSASARDFATEMTQRGLNYDAILFPSIAAMRTAFDEGRCSAQVLERSLLEIMRSSSAAPENFTVWPTPFTRRSITPLYHYGDEAWGQIVDWTLLGLIQAEKLGITSQNIDTLMRRSAEDDAAYVARVGEAAAHLLDENLGVGQRLGLHNNFMVEVIRQVGNYGEIYERNLGLTTQLPIERGLNALWSQGGLLDVPMWR